MSKASPTGSVQQTRMQQLGAEARRNASAYIARGAWAEANRNDDEAIRRAQELAGGRPVPEAWLP
jgi:hypothetical protein